LTPLAQCPIYQPLQPHAVGLLLGALWVGDVDRLLHGRRPAAWHTAAQWSAANASSVTFTATVEG